MKRLIEGIMSLLIFTVTFLVKEIIERSELLMSAEIFGKNTYCSYSCI